MRASADKGVILGACDRVRDDVLPALGVRLEDVNSDPPSSRWELDDAKLLLREIEERRAAEAAKKAAKQAKEAEKARKKLADAESAAIPPLEFFKTTQPNDFKEIGADGLSTQDAAGQPMTKSALKKLKKTLDKQTKEHQKLLTEMEKLGLGQIPEYLDQLRAKLQ
eukprot:FR735748.1.p1 GENE.FR735748.1~~FR735748.1.p1  ORF type:complete len:166 (+),score=31.98 FR735748.1:1-498(+)